MNQTVRSNFGGILTGIEEKTGIKISTFAFAEAMPISYNQARRIRADETTRFDADTLVKFIEFCKRFGMLITFNDIFKLVEVEEEQDA